MREVSSGTFDAGDCTPVYFLQGFFNFDDAKGYKHMCSLNHQFFLKLGPDSDSCPANVAPTEGWGSLFAPLWWIFLGSIRIAS